MLFLFVWVGWLLFKSFSCSDLKKNFSKLASLKLLERSEISAWVLAVTEKIQSHCHYYFEIKASDPAIM